MASKGIPRDASSKEISRDVATKDLVAKDNTLSAASLPNSVDPKRALFWFVVTSLEER